MGLFSAITNQIDSVATQAEKARKMQELEQQQQAQMANVFGGGLGGASTFQ
jgi:hypothetical protein